MRQISLAIILIAGAPAAAEAAVITESLPVGRTGVAFFGDIGVAIPAFNASLGTLTDETLTMTGFFTPGEAWVISSGPQLTGAVPVTLGAKVGVLPNQFEQLPDVSAVASPGLGGYVAYAPPVDAAFTVTGDVPLAYAGGSGGGDVWAETVPVTNIPGYWATADVGTLSAMLTVAYSYTPADPPGDPVGVPEPPSWMLLGFGLITLAGAARRTHK